MARMRFGRFVSALKPILLQQRPRQHRHAALRRAKGLLDHDDRARESQRRRRRSGAEAPVGRRSLRQISQRARGHYWVLVREIRQDGKANVILGKAGL